MKKLVVFVVVLMIASMSYASDISLERLFNDVYDSDVGNLKIKLDTTKTLSVDDAVSEGTTTTHRTGITTDSLAWDVPLGSGYDATGYKTIRLDIARSPLTSFRLEPNIGSATLGRYTVLSAEVLELTPKAFAASEDICLFIDVYGAADVYFKTLSGTYTAPGPSLYITPVR